MTEAKKPYKIQDRPPTIFRVVKSKDNPYVMIDRRPIENAKLSFKAKGILTYLLSRPDGWEVSVADLIKRGTDGEAAIRAGLKELKNAGHMKYTTSRKSGRITGWLIEVYEVPDGDFQQVVIQEVEKQDVENRTQVLKTLSSQENNKKNEDDPALAEISKAYQNEIAMLTPMIADELRDAVKTFPLKWILDAIHEAAVQNKRGWKYVLAILTRWKAQGNQEAMKPMSQKANTFKPRDLIQERYGGIMEWAKEAQEHDDTTRNGNDHGANSGSVPQLEA